MIPIRTTAPRFRRPTIVLLLIATNTLVFLAQNTLPPRESFAFVVEYALIPLRYTDPQWAVGVGLDPTNRLPLFTNIFMHSGWLHLIGNMWTLWLFGGSVEDRLGRLRFTLFYLACGLAASWAHLVFNATSQIPTLGASGAIAAVMGAHITLFPRSRVLLLIPIIIIPLFIPMPIFLYAGIWFALQLAQGAGALFLGPTMAGGVAWWAHIGGFLAGLLLIRLIAPPVERGPWGSLPDVR